MALALRLALALAGAGCGSLVLLPLALFPGADRGALNSGAGGAQ